MIGVTPLTAEVPMRDSRNVTCDAGRTAAQRQAAYRARKGTPVQVFLDAETLAGLDAYIARQHKDGDVSATRSSVIAKQLRAGLLRKR